MKQNQPQRELNDRWRTAPLAIIVFIVALLWLSPLLAQPALAQDVTNTGTVHVNGTTTVYMGSNFTNNTGATFTNDGNVQVQGAFNFQNGRIDEPNSGLVIFLDNATAVSAADASHVVGTVRKIGNDAFVFPTGDGGQYGPVGISASATTADQIDARYRLVNPQTALGTTRAAGLTALSTVEYWQVSGTASVNLTLYWDSGSNLGALGGTLAELRVAGWNGSQWVDLGNSATTGNSTAGTVTSTAVTPTSYQAYAIGTVANVASTPDLTTSLGQPSPNLVVGQTSNVPLTVNNIGSGPTAGTVTASMTLSTNTSAPANFTSNGWTCTTSGQTVTCTSAAVIAAGGSSAVQVPVTPAAATVGTQPVFTATASGGGETNTANNSSTMTPTASVIVVGIEYTLVFNVATNRYEVYMRPTVTAGAPGQTLTAQVTIKAPHVAGSGAFTITNVIPFAGTQWTASDVVRAPTEGPTSDYLSVQLQATTNALNWQAGQAILVFSFQNTGTCAGPVGVMVNSDAFNTLPNSVNSNPGNQIEVLGLGSDPGNDYIGNYGNPTVMCVLYPDLTISLGQPTPALTAELTSTLPVTVANIGAIPTSGPITVSVPLPANVSSPASFTNNGWTCTTAGQTVTCTNPGPINAGENRPFGVPVIPAMAAIGTTPTFNASVSTAPELITSNNNATPVTANTAVAGGTVLLPIKVFLGGAYNTGTGLMRDDLRTKDLIPLREPYTALSGFTHTNGGGGEQVNASVFSVTGNNAIVDWVFVELRNSATPATVVATRAALVQRDGDVVGLDGVTSLVLPGSFNNQTYAIAVRHRNHLGVMTASSVMLTSTTALIDFTLPATAVYGTNAEKVVGSVRVLWHGNANSNKSIIYTGPSNDINAILITVLNAPGNSAFNRNYVVNGYNQSDIDLDGRTIAAGPGNDVNPVLANVYTHPGNSAVAANYIIGEQLP